MGPVRQGVLRPTVTARLGLVSPESNRSGPEGTTPVTASPLVDRSRFRGRVVARVWVFHTFGWLYGRGVRDLTGLVGPDG